ncbi:MAG: hypothetical protein ACRDYU_05150 [Actinomycetes bacterium]
MNASTTGSTESTTTATAGRTSAELAVRPVTHSPVQAQTSGARPPLGPRDTLSDDVRSSLMLMASTAAFALAVVALGTLVSGVPG